MLNRKNMQQRFMVLSGASRCIEGVVEVFKQRTTRCRLIQILPFQCNISYACRKRHSHPCRSAALTRAHVLPYAPAASQHGNTCQNTSPVIAAIRYQETGRTSRPNRNRLSIPPTIDLAVGPLPNVKVSQIPKAAGSDRYRTFYFSKSL